MSYRSIHLHLSASDELTSPATIAYAVGLAKAFDAVLTVASPRLDVLPPTPWFARALVSNLEREIEQAASAKAAELEDEVRRQAAVLTAPAQIIAVREIWPKGASDPTAHGRTSDLCVVGLPRAGVDPRPYVEDWLFASGRPCILHPDARTGGAFRVDIVALAWDASRSAARAVSDALPLLKRAKRVRALVVRGEKEIVSPAPLSRLGDWLGAHGLAAEVEEIQLSGKRIGPALLDASSGADVLVMGAFGHARQRDFVLGGATMQVLNEASLPLFMAH
jgi:nucleotide-binding universal stress UspA family protein